MKPRFFATPADFRSWLAEHHDMVAELLVGYWKKATGKPSVTWEETVDEALCYGWIDGVRRRIDDASFTVRFTPRRPGSIWSPRNLERVEALRADGRMEPPGLAAWEARRPDASKGYEARQEEAAFTAEQQAAFGDAWAFWEAQPPGYRKQWTHWVQSAKQEATRTRRLEALVAASRLGRRVNPQRPFDLDD
ncbi:MAG: YdeI/OmpD-associated family protein [Thermoplasmatota archaeon]